MTNLWLWGRLCEPSGYGKTYATIKNEVKLVMERTEKVSGLSVIQCLMSIKESHTVPGSQAGSMFQPVRALHWLATAPRGATVGVETEDDVTVLLESGGKTRKIREQDKTSTQDKSLPYGDKSESLWNTLAIWVNAVKSGEVELEFTQFFLVTNKDIRANGLALQMSKADNETKASECYNRLVTIRSTMKGGSKVDQKAKEVMALGKEDLCKLIHQITCEKFSAVLGSKDRAEIASKFHLTERESHDIIIDQLIGWLSTTLISMWNNGKPGWIHREAMDNQLDRLRGELRRKRFRASPARELLISEEEKNKQIEKLFVKQLEIISAEEDIAYEAIVDFIRCGKEKLRFAQEGKLTGADWDEFHTKLEEKWKTIFRLYKLEEHIPEEKLGQKVFHKTMAIEEPRVGEVETEQYLVKGSYHHLSNELSVGWHPKYKKILQKFVKM